jgi:hypothetical protein
MPVLTSSDLVHVLGMLRSLMPQDSTIKKEGQGRSTLALISNPLSPTNPGPLSCYCDSKSTAHALRIACL